MNLKNITLEISLKPFKQTDDEYIDRVCRTAFEQWKNLTKSADCVSVMFWTGDGSELLDYDGYDDTPFEWAYMVGNANYSEGRSCPTDPEGLELHMHPRKYIENPPVMTYGILKKIVAAFKRVGKEVLGNKTIRVGTTFDPGPEFAKSDFKYNRHPEICTGNEMGKNIFVCSYTTLKGDNRRYAGYPDGIPNGLSFGKFFGRQSKCFLDDMGFDYIWFSNGLGFGRDVWSTTGAIFDGENFDTSALPEIKKLVFDFWGDFRSECPDYPIEVRGTNMTMGIDMASDGVPLREIYNGGFNILPPPNSPWAALDGDFGLELAGYMSRMANIPNNEYLFRFYVHDPWWLNSPWYDRYNGMPHDIYLPLAVSRIDENGKVRQPTHLNLLSIDNSYGDLVEQCANECTPHLLKGIKEAPDEPSPLVWVYPFDEYSDATENERVMQMFSGDWFIRSCINNGLPLSTVVSTTNFVRHDKSIYSASILITPVPEANSAFESVVLEYIDKGGKVIFYGSTRLASDRFKTLVGVKTTEGISGELDVTVDGEPHGKILHTSLVCGGDITEVSTSDNVIASAGGRPIATKGKNLVWLRAVTSNKYVRGSKLLIPHNEKNHFIADRLILRALKEFGIDIRYEKPLGEKPPVMMIHKHNGAFIFSTFHKSTTIKTSIKMPLGAPVLDGYSTLIENGYATYHFPRAERRECRVFVEQTDGVVNCRELNPGSAFMRRRIEVSGLKNATVRFVAENYCKENVDIRLNTQGSARILTDPFESRYVTENGVTYCEISGVSGVLTLSMPMKKQMFFEL